MALTPAGPSANMVGKPNGPIGRFLHRRALARWTAATRQAGSADLSVLRTQRQQARQLRSPLLELCHIAESRLALPRIGSNNFHRPAGTDWSWRPQAWRAGLPLRGIAPALNKTALGRELTLFHDCRASEISLCQCRNTSDRDLAPYGVAVEVFDFDGSFLSLVVDLPHAACKGLRKNHLIRLAGMVTSEVPLTVFARLNVKHGANTDQSLKKLTSAQQEIAVEFDLAYGHMNEARVERIWVDLMFEKPQMNRVTIGDLTFCRYPRAAL